MYPRISKLLTMLAKLSARAATVGLVVLRLGPGAPAEASTRATVDDRIQRIRVALNERNAYSADGEEGREAGGIKLAQWGNWGNWGNWANWNNWQNWGNWGNWGNFG